MSLTLKNLDLKKINAPYPIGYIDNFLSEESCKKLFEEICAANDLTPSQVVRRLVRQYIIEHADGRDLPEWLKPGAAKE